MSDAYARPANLLGALVDAVSSAVEAATETASGQGGLAPAALLQLAQHERLSVDQLRRRIGLTHSGTVRLLDGLAGRGLVERQRSGEDGRTTQLRLTPAGAALADQVATARRAALVAALRPLTAKQRDGLVDAMETVLRALPTSVEHSSQICRLCWLSDCPAAACPVEIRCQELVSHGG